MSESAETAIPCVHHWILQAPSANATIGVCRDCGATRSYSDDTVGRWRLGARPRRS